MILILVGLFSLIFVGGFFLVLSLIGIRQQVRWRIFLSSLTYRDSSTSSF